MIKCKCDIATQVKRGTPTRIDDKVYWKLIYKCVNPNCESCNKPVGEELVNMFDESEIIKTEY